MKIIIYKCLVGSCPMVELDEQEQEEKQICIKDEFGNIVYMAKEQLKEIIDNVCLNDF